MKNKGKTHDLHHETILILDFGSQYSQLIARRVREKHVFSQIVPHNITLKKIKQIKPSGLIISGGPASVYQKGAPFCSPEIFSAGVPILGICYGMQLMTHLLGGKVISTDCREYGGAEIKVSDKKDLFKGLKTKFNCWMSHGDYISRMPAGFNVMAGTKNTPIAAFADHKKKFYGLQFHPEVMHTDNGIEIIDNFIRRICKCHGKWTMASFIDDQVKKIRAKVGKQRVVLGLSGGVDSSVTAALLSKAIGRQLSCVFVNNGLLRKNEAKEVIETFSKFDLDFHYVDAAKKFLNGLKGVTDPEKKRKIIGEAFIRVFEAQARRIGDIKFLAQGTLYPDVIESRSAFGGPSATIKSHHNVGGLPDDMEFKLIEPLNELFKDEVRALGKELRLPYNVLMRHPFPGPGLGIRIIGAVTKQRLEVLREADFRFIDEIRKARLYSKIWQAFAVLLPIKTVGVMGDERTYENVVALRAVTSTDGMTSDWAKIPPRVLAKMSNRIINEVKGINRVTYDISSKPPATIEWE